MHRALSDQQRRVAFAISAVLVVGVVAIVSALGGGQRVHGHNRPVGAATRSSASAVPRIVDASAATTSSTASTSRTSTAATSTATRLAPHSGRRQVILADVHAFLSAYLVYEVRPLDARRRATLRASTTPEFGRHLLRVRVNLPARNRPSLERVRTLRFVGRPDRTRATVAATVQNGAWVSRLMLQMRSRDGRWLVSHLS